VLYQGAMRQRRWATSESLVRYAPYIVAVIVIAGLIAVHRFRETPMRWRGWSTLGLLSVCAMIVFELMRPTVEFPEPATKVRVPQLAESRR
jgi:hypothetical protein